MYNLKKKKREPWDGGFHDGGIVCNCRISLMGNWGVEPAVPKKNKKNKALRGRKVAVGAYPPVHMPRSKPGRLVGRDPFCPSYQLEKEERSFGRAWVAFYGPFSSTLGVIMVVNVRVLAFVIDVFATQ